jgi:hypothetical protein
MKKKLVLLPEEIIERKIYLIRGVKVMLDKDLAFLYEIKPIALRQQVKRNKERFPSDFMFQLNKKETEILLSQNVIASKKVLGGFLPYVFTEHGITMLSSILKSKKAIQVNIAIVRAFIKLRELLSTHKDIILEIEKIKEEQKNQNQKINSVINVIGQMLNPNIDEKEQIGFKEKNNKK